MNKAFFRIKQISKILKKPPSNVVKLVAYRHRKRFYCFHDSVWLQFPTIKDIIIPHSAIRCNPRINYLFAPESPIAATSPKLFDQTLLAWTATNNKSLENSNSKATLISELPHLPSPPWTGTVPVIVILGHFNHGILETISFVLAICRLPLYVRIYYSTRVTGASYH